MGPRMHFYGRTCVRVCPEVGIWRICSVLSGENSVRWLSGGMCHGCQMQSTPLPCAADGEKGTTLESVGGASCVKILSWHQDEVTRRSTVVCDVADTRTAVCGVTKSHFGLKLIGCELSKLYSWSSACVRATRGSMTRGG